MGRKVVLNPLFKKSGLVILYMGIDSIGSVARSPECDNPVTILNPALPQNRFFAEIFKDRERGTGYIGYFKQKKSWKEPWDSQIALKKKLHLSAPKFSFLKQQFTIKRI